MAAALICDERPMPGWWVSLLAMLPGGTAADDAVGAEAQDDVFLVRQALNGDSRAFERLVRRHYDRIYRVAWRQTGSATDAEDVAQTVLLQLVERLGSWRGEARFTTWLTGVTLNACRDHGRRAGSFGRMRRALAHFTQATEQSGEEPSDPVRRRWLDSILSRLSPELRETVVLVAGEGLSHREAALELKVAENTIAWRMHQVRKRLTAAMAEAGEPASREMHS